MRLRFSQISQDQRVSGDIEDISFTMTHLNEVVAGQDCDALHFLHQITLSVGMAIIAFQMLGNKSGPLVLHDGSLLTRTDKAGAFSS